jgi:hypothetical protein
MAGLGDLVVNLSANTQKFDKNISKSQGGLKAFATSAMSALNPVTAAFTAMAAGAVGVGAAVWGLTSRIGTLAGVADKAAQTGLSGAFLQQLEYAADQSGVSAETLTGGIKKLTVMIGKAGSGSKEAADALKDIGLSATDLQRLSPEQQFEKVAAGIGKIPTAAGRAAAAVKIFGKSGIEMTGLFAGGLDDITKLMQDAKDIGIGLDDDQLARVASADDSLQKMYASISAMVDQVAVGLAPAFEAVAKNVTGLIGPVTNLFDTFNNMDNRWEWLGNTLVAAFDVGIETIKIHWADMISELLKQTAEFGIDIAKFGLALTNPTLMAQQGVEMAQKAGARPGAQDGLQGAQGRLAGLLGQFKGAADENKPQIDADPVKAAEQAQDAALQTFEDTLNAAKEALAKTRAAFEQWDATPITDANYEAIKAAYYAANKISDQAIELRNKASSEFDVAKANLEKLNQQKQKQESQDKFNSGIASMFGKLKDSPLIGTIESLKMRAEGMIDRAKIQAGAIGGTLSNWLGTDREKQKIMTPQLSGAMAGGSAEAYSTIVQAMMTRGKDPVVAATEKQTKELIKGLKPKSTTKNIMSFLGIE